jgi:hypothetical protein
MSSLVLILAEYPIITLIAAVMISQSSNRQSTAMVALWWENLTVAQLPA